MAKKAKTPAPSSAVGSSGEAALQKIVTLKYTETLNLPSDGVSGAKKRKRAEEEETGQEDGSLAKKAKMPAAHPEAAPSGETALQEMMAPRMANEDLPGVQASNDAPLSQKSAEKAEEVSDAAKGVHHAEAEKNIPLPEKSEEKATGENNNKADEKEQEEKAAAAPKATARKNTNAKAKARFATPALPARSPYNTRSRRRAEDVNARAPPAPGPGA